MRSIRVVVGAGRSLGSRSASPGLSSSGPRTRRRGERAERATSAGVEPAPAAAARRPARPPRAAPAEDLGGLGQAEDPRRAAGSPPRAGPSGWPPPSQCSSSERIASAVAAPKSSMRGDLGAALAAGRDELARGRPSGRARERARARTAIRPARRPQRPREAPAALVRRRFDVALGHVVVGAEHAAIRAALVEQPASLSSSA